MTEIRRPAIHGAIGTVRRSIEGPDLHDGFGFLI
jgi:hypothetical protein